MKKWVRLHTAFRSNVFPAMLEDLATHLGVDPASLDRLDLGWAPIVEFKRGKNYQGWWVIPERDEHGEIVGLSLRSQSDMKVMYPGSKHGLIYALNPKHEASDADYHPGPQNWVRTMDVGLPCPVCDKPDGCLLHHENPDSPQAVICIRESSKRKLKFGYLHVLRESGNFDKTATPVAPSDKPVLVVEGMTDVAAAADMGFEAVGRPSNLGGMDALKNLLRGRKVIIVGENDKKDDGKEPGKEGMLAAFQTLRRVCKDIKKVMPPEDVKDLRQWRRRYLLTADQFLTYVEDIGDSKADDIVIEDDRPLTLAHRFLMDSYRLAGRWTLRYFKGGWFKFNGAKYSEVEVDWVRNELYAWSHDKYVMTTKPDGSEVLQRVAANRAWVANVEDAMRSLVAVHSDECPVWLDGRKDDRRLISFTNGIMDLDKYLDGADFDEYMDPPTPDYFVLVAMPFAFDPAAPYTTWKKFVFSSIGDETGKIQCLQEYLGYIISGETSRQKFLILRGVPGSGKSTIINTVAALVGKDQFAETNLTSLGDTFGLSSLMGTLVATMTELKQARSELAERSLEMILKIVGEDPVTINRKFREPIKGHKLSTRFLMAANELPYFADHTGALRRRLMIIEFQKSFVHSPDLKLQQKLNQELQGICVWALEGLRRLQRDGCFTQPKSSLEALDQWKLDTSPVSTFISDCIETVADTCIPETSLYAAYRAWTEERGGTAMRLSRFRQLFSDATPAKVYGSRRREDGTGRLVPVFENCKFNPWVETEYFGKPKNS